MLFPNAKQKALTLSYDDGVQQDIRFIEILDKYGIKCLLSLSRRITSGIWKRSIRRCARP